MHVRTGLNTTRRYALEAGLATEAINPLLNPQMVRLKGSMGSLNPVGRIIESAATTCAGAFVSVWTIGWARADSNTRQTTAAESGSLVRNLSVIFNVLLSIIPECRLGLCSWLLVIGWRFLFP